MNLNKTSSWLARQVLEYHTEPWDQWVNIGYLQVAREHYGVLSIGTEQLPCFSGENHNWRKGNQSIRFQIQKTVAYIPNTP